MEKAEMISNVRKMMDYADERMMGVVKEKLQLMLEDTPYHYVKFAFYPHSGACIEQGSWGNTYDRLYSDITEHYGGWDGGVPERTTYEKAPNYVLRDGMMRLAMLNWVRIKATIKDAIDKEIMIDNFQL